MSRTRRESIAAMVFTALVLGTAARAGWTSPGGSAGTPIDVTVPDAGQLVVITTDGGYEFVGNNVARTLPAPNVRSGFIDGAGCFGVINSSGLVEFVDLCGSGFQVPWLREKVQRLRISTGGYAWACSSDVSGNEYAYSATGGMTAASWTRTASPGPCAAPLSVLSVPPSEYALFTMVGVADNVALYRNGALEDTATTISGQGTAPLSVQLVGGGGVPVRAFTVTSTGGLEVAAIDGGVQTFDSIPPPVGVARFQAMALHQSDTERFGVALAELGDGGLRILSAIPDPSAANFGREWRESTAPPATVGGPWKELQCLGALACGATTASSGAGSVLSYVNASPPNPPAIVSARVPAGGSVVLPVTATDPDGDAVWLTWQQVAPSSPLLGVVADQDGASLTVTAPTPVCESSIAFTLEVKAEDGRAGHVSAPTPIVITVDGTSPEVGRVDGGPLLASCESLAGGASVIAEGELTHAPAPGSCSNYTVQWSQTSGPAVLAGPLEASAVPLWTKSAMWDDLVGQEVQLELVARSGTTASSPVPHRVPIIPKLPFVRAAISAETPMVNEIGAVGISVTLINGSECGVRGATAAAFLAGARLIQGTIRLDGSPIDAVVMADGIRLPELQLVPGVPRVIQFDVRPPLLGSLTMRALALIDDVPISEEVGLGKRPEIGGCGCGSGGDVLAVWGGVFALALRRRRAGRRRGA